MCSHLCPQENTNKMAKADEMRWYGHVLRREDDGVLRKTLEFKLDGEKRGRPKMTWKTQMEKEIGKVGLKQDDAFNQTKQLKGVKIAMRCVATSFHRKTPHQKYGKMISRIKTKLLQSSMF